VLRQQKDVAIFVGGAQDDDGEDGSGNGGPHSHGGNGLYMENLLKIPLICLECVTWKIHRWMKRGSPIT
jgi:hypothetical protein